VNPDPLWTAIVYLLERARQRARAALDGHPEAGALSLEWIVIASLLVVAAVAAGVFFRNIISTWENQVPTGP
jgi:hypothetical protein